jgi:hypothetical protein
VANARIAIGLVLLLLAGALSQASSDDYARIFAVAMTSALLSAVALLGPAQSLHGRWRTISRIGLALSVLMTLYAAVALFSIITSE